MEQFDRQKTIETIIRTEWDMFQQTDNIGGRASCQDDPETFYIMRASQYENWTDSMLSCWTSFLEKSKNEGRNLVTEKYGRMKLCDISMPIMPATPLAISIPPEKSA